MLPVRKKIVKQFEKNFKNHRKALGKGVYSVVSLGYIFTHPSAGSTATELLPRKPRITTMVSGKIKSQSLAVAGTECLAVVVLSF